MESETLNADVAIIGAGPAGATLATLLARKGLCVVLVDKDEFPRDKVCGEFFSYDGLPLLSHIVGEASLASSGAARISRCSIASARPYQFDLPFEARGISRRLLDAMLVDRARAAGADVRTGATVTQLIPAEGRFEFEKGGRRFVVNARQIAGAWGRWGRFDLQLQRTFVHDRRQRYFGFKRHFESAHPVDAIELHSFRAGYLGISAVEDGRTNLCGLVHADRIANLRGGWTAFTDELSGENPQLGRFFRDSKALQENYITSEPVIFRARTPEAAGILMVGDAAGLIDPLTGNGMSMALQSALLAAQTIIDSFAGRISKTPGSEYRRRYEVQFTTRMRWSRAAAVILRNPSVMNAAAKFAAFKPAEIFLSKTRSTPVETEMRIEKFERSRV